MNYRDRGGYGTARAVASTLTVPCHRSLISHTLVLLFDEVVAHDFLFV